MGRLIKQAIRFVVKLVLIYFVPLFILVEWVEDDDATLKEATKRVWETIYG